VALPTKGSKRITVDGGFYRWVVTMSDAGIRVIVQPRVRRGDSAGRIVVDSDYWPCFGRELDPERIGLDLRVGAQTLAISPDFVRQAIQFARIECGWTSASPELSLIAKQGRFVRAES